MRAPSLGGPKDRLVPSSLRPVPAHPARTPGIASDTASPASSTPSGYRAWGRLAACRVPPLGDRSPARRCARATWPPLFELLARVRRGIAPAKHGFVRGFSNPPGPTLVLAITLVCAACASIGGDGGEGVGAPEDR